MADLADLTPEESHRAGISVLIALTLRREQAAAKALEWKNYNPSVWRLYQARATAFAEAIALIEPTATIGERTNAAPAPVTSKGPAPFGVAGGATAPTETTLGDQTEGGRTASLTDARTEV